MESDSWDLDGMLGSPFTSIYTPDKERHLHFSDCSMRTWYSRAWTRISDILAMWNGFPRSWHTPKTVYLHPTQSVD